MAILIRKNKAGKPRYRVCVRDALGATYPTKTFGTLRDAKHYERELQDKKDKKYQAMSLLKRNIEVHQYVAEWLHYRKQNLSVGWHKKISHMTNVYVLPFIGTMKLGEVPPTYIGNILGITENSAKVNFFKAKNNLKKRIKRARERNAIATIFIGEKVAARNMVQLKDMDSGNQDEVSLDLLEQELQIYK